MGSNAKHRNKLFSIYSTNLSIYRPELEDKFLCPLCQNIFSRDDLQPGKLTISLAHVIPKSIGGGLKTLACSRCDNELGHQCDIHLAREKIKYDNINKNNTVEYGRFTPHGHKGINVMIDSAEMHGPKPNLKLYNPPNMPSDVFRRYLKNVKYPPDEIRFSLEIREPKLKVGERNRSLIYSAFLMMFYQFGYEYVLSENADYLRQAIYGRVESYDFINAILFIKGGPMDGRFTLPTFAIIRISKNLNFISSLIPFDKEASFLVMLPGFGTGDIDTYSNLLKGAYDIQQFDIRVIPRDILPYHLDNPGSKDSGKNLYEQIIKL